MTIDIESTAEYYKNLLIVQYNNKEKAGATIELLSNVTLDNDIVSQVQDAFNIDTAVGVQLDVLGKYIGKDRFINGQVPIVGDFFSMTSYPTLGTDTGIGMTDYANYNTDPGGFLNYGDIFTSAGLSDDNYRIILQLRIVQNNSDHSHKSIDDGLYSFFEDGIVMSARENMTMVYFVTNEFLQIALIAADKKVLPRPMGVKLNGLIKRDKKFFGFTRYNRTSNSINVTGFTNYTTGFAKEGEVLTYDKVINL